MIEVTISQDGEQIGVLTVGQETDEPTQATAQLFAEAQRAINLTAQAIARASAKHNRDLGPEAWEAVDQLSELVQSPADAGNLPLWLTAAQAEYLALSLSGADLDLESPMRQHLYTRVMKLKQLLGG